MFAPQPPVYDHYLKQVGSHTVLCIIDRYEDAQPTLTVTNGAELVLEELARKLGKLPAMIIYRDSEGEWDRLKADPDGRFKGVSPIVPGRPDRITDEAEALRLAVAMLADASGTQH